VGLFGSNEAVGIAFQGKDEVSPVVRGIRNTMSGFKRDAATGFGLGAGISIFNTAKMAIGAVVDVLGDAVNAAIEEEASIAQMNRAIEENDAAWDGNVDRIEGVISAREKLAFSDGEQRDSLRQLVAVTKDVDKALALQATAMDLARLRNMSLADAGTLVGKVYAGNVGILSRYGIVLEKGTSSTEALAEIQKRAEGQAETFAETTQGKMVVASIALENAMESLGSALLPVVGQLAEIAAEHIPHIIEGIDEIVETARRFDPAFDRVVQVNDAFDALEERLGLTNGELDESRAKWAAMAQASDRVTGTVEELTAAFWNENKAMLWTIGHQRELDAMYGSTGKAAAGLVIETEELDAAMSSLADGGLAEAREAAKAAQKEIRDLLRGGDEQKSVRKLRAELRLLARQKRQAANRERPEAYAAITARQEVVQSLLRERRTVLENLRATKRAERDKRREARQTEGAIDDVASAVEGIPTNTTIKLDVIGEDQVAAAVRMVSNLVAMSGNVVSVFLQGIGGKGGQRAHGGEVGSRGTYLVGERGPELLTMGAGSGRITPNHRMGGGGGNVYLDGQLVGRVLDERMGRQFGMTAAGGFYRS
jgi:hypothetical protein